MNTLDLKIKEPVHQLHKYTLNNEEVSVIENLIYKLQKKFETVEQESFANLCKLISHEMPLHTRKLFDDFRNRRFLQGYLLLEGFPINDENLGPTPPHWDTAWINPKTLREEIFQCLISSCLGDIFGWLTQENGRYLRHIVPIESDRNEQLGGSSSVTLL